MKPFILIALCALCLPGCCLGCHHRHHPRPWWREDGEKQSQPADAEKIETNKGAK